jgi:hypothetical protein
MVAGCKPGSTIKKGQGRCGKKVVTIEMLGIQSGWPQVLIYWTLAGAGGLLLLALFTHQMASSLSSIESMLDDSKGRDR